MLSTEHLRVEKSITFAKGALCIGLTPTLDTLAADKADVFGDKSIDEWER